MSTDHDALLCRFPDGLASGRLADDAEKIFEQAKAESEVVRPKVHRDVGSLRHGMDVIR